MLFARARGGGPAWGAEGLEAARSHRKIAAPTAPFGKGVTRHARSQPSYYVMSRTAPSHPRAYDTDILASMYVCEAQRQVPNV